MSIETNVINALLTYSAGTTFSCLDRLFSKNAKRRTQERLQEKLEQTDALNYLIDSEQNRSLVEGGQAQDYHKAILKARNYFEQNGISLENKGLVDKVRHYRDNERINKVPAGKQLALAYGFELAADIGVVLSRISMGVGSPLAAIGHTAYQGFALFLGMQTGKGILYVRDKWLRSQDEKELDSIAKGLTADGKLLSIVRSYSPTANLNVVEGKVIEQPELPEGTQEKKYTSPTDVGKQIGEGIASTAEKISSGVSAGLEAIRSRMQEKYKAKQDKQEAEAQAKSKNFRNQLKGF